MKHYFFVNPVAGKGNQSKELIEEIKIALKDTKSESVIIMTEPNRGSEARARAIADGLNGEPARFYACGGDGTANEIASAVIGFDGIELGIIPIGSGNDMIRNFQDAGDFMSLRSQLNGKSRKVDVMKYTSKLGNEEQTGYCLNMFNIGFDCNVVETAFKLRKKKFFAGATAYQSAILFNFIKKRGACLDIYEDGKQIREGKMLLCAISNGSYCGGGIKSSPQAIIDDGFFDLNIINDLPRLKFLKLLPKYKEGTHLEVDGIDKIIYVKKSKQLSLKPKGTKDFGICIDGELARTEGIDIEICEKALSFIVPVDVK